MNFFLLLLSKWKRFFQITILVFGTLAVYVFFPAESRLDVTVQSILLSVVFFVVLPILFVKLILHESLSVLGFQGSKSRFGIVAVLAVVIPIVSVWYIFLRTYPVAESYYLPAVVHDSFPFFLLYEIILIGSLAFLYEVFFRGFVLILWLRKTGIWAVFFQSALFAFFLMASGVGFSWQDAPLLLASLGSGFVAFYTRSVPYSWLSAWLILFLSDVLILIIR